MNPQNKRPLPRTQWMLRLEPALAALIDVAAKRYGVSRNALIEHLLENEIGLPALSEPQTTPEQKESR